MKNLLYVLSLVYSIHIHSQTKFINPQSNINIFRIKNDLKNITQTKHSRNHKNIKTLNTVAGYIKSQLTKVCDSVAFQPYLVDGKTYKNVIGSIGITNKKRLIIGAHYDVFGNQQGADDNASGVAGLLELARLLSTKKLNYRIDFVAYTLEEPPFFRTKNMGSHIHANYLYSNNIPVKGMICLEMIGYYSDKRGSQSYPLPEMVRLYGNKADFISIVMNEKSEEFGNQVETLMKPQNLIKTIAFKESGLVRGVDYSDHLNYWNLNYPAVMITNTAFYRNKNYHTKADTLDTLDIDKMRAVIEQLYIMIKELK